MARAVLITNPAAARTTQRAVEAVRNQLRTAGWQLEVGDGGTGRRAARREEAVQMGMEMVVVQGGDGTTMQAAAALVGTDVALGMVPGGTGNLLAGNLRIPRSVLGAARVLRKGHLRRIDLGRMEREDGPHYFSVAAGTGVDARIMAETASEEKRRWGIGAYMATTLRILPERRSCSSLVPPVSLASLFRGSRRCAGITPPAVMFSWFLAILLAGRTDAFTDQSAQTQLHIYVIAWIGEVVEMMIAIAAVLFVWLKRDELVTEWVNYPGSPGEPIP